MRVALDANPLFGPRTGVGTYVANLAAALAQLPNGPEVVLPTVSVRASGRAPAIPGTTSHHRRAPFRAVQAMWDRTAWPPAEWVLGRADVFHATNFVAPPFHRTPLVTTVHDLSFVWHADLADDRVRRYREWVPDTIHRSRRVIALARATADDIVQLYGLDPEVVVPIHLGVDPAWHGVAADASWRDRHGLPHRYLLVVGGGTERKNVGLALRAHRAAREQDPLGVPPLLLAGPPPAPTVLQHARADDVHVLGYLAEEDLRRLVAGADALLYPSRYEGFGLPILEAMAAGTSVVASDLAVHREVAGGHARLVDVEAGDDSDRVRRLAAAIADVSTVAATADELDAARAWVSGFTWERTAAATLRVYEEAAG